jgi:hypothetical protein
MSKNKNSSKRQQRNLRVQQIIFIIIGVMIILSMIISMIVN